MHGKHITELSPQPLSHYLPADSSLLSLIMILSYFCNNVQCTYAPSFCATVSSLWSVEPTNMREAESLTLLHLSLLQVTLHTTLQKGDPHNFLLQMKRRCRQTKSSTPGQRIQMPCLALTWHSPDSSERKDPAEELPSQLACGRACELLS